MTARLVVDWPLCQAHGLCAEVLPEVLALDEWGYPVVTESIEPGLRLLAAAAVDACPVAALRVTGRQRSRRSS